MRQTLPRRFVLALAAAFTLPMLGACDLTPNTSTPPPPPPPAGSRPVSALTASGKIRIALLLPLSGRSAAIGQSLQQAAEMSLFDTGAKELALAAYDSGDTPDSAIAAYGKARTEGVALVLGPLFGSSAAALASFPAQGGANVISFSNDEQAAKPGIWVMGIAPPPQVRRVVDYAVQTGIHRFAALAPRTAYGEQMTRTLESHVAVRGGEMVAAEFYDQGGDVQAVANHLADEVKRSAGAGQKVGLFVPVAPPQISSVLASLSSAGLDSASIQFIGTGVWDVAGIGADPTLRGAWDAAPDPARRADFERRFVSTYGRPPHRLATLAYDAVALAARLAKMKPGGDFSAEAITNPNGWSGVDGAFRLMPDGRSERALAVIQIQGERGVVVSPAPTTFASQTTN
jgi:branched-chain amino acid transport system substrate-binding protein